MAYNLQEIEQQIADLRNQLAPLQKYNEQPTGAEFSEALRGKMTEPEDVENLIKRIAESRSRMLAIPAETRAQQQPGLFSPTQVSSLIEQRQEPVRTQWETFMGMKQARTGQMEQIIARATEGYKASIEKAQKKYDDAYKQLQDLVEEKKWIEQQQESSKRFEEEMALTQSKQAEATRQWEAEMAMKKSQFAQEMALAQQKAATTGAGMDFLSISEAQALGVPFGTTESQAMQMGIQPLSQSTRNTLVTIDSSTAIINQISSAMGNIEFGENWIQRATKGIGQWIGAKTQADTDAALFESLKEGLLSNLARATGERGVLTDYDVQRARNLLPKLTDTKAVAQGKIKQLSSLMEEFKGKAQETLTSPFYTGPTGSNQEVTVTAPDGVIYVFPSQEAANNFKREIGVK